MTNQIESGNQELEIGIYDKRWEEIANQIESYLARIRIRAKTPDSVIEKILELPHEQLRLLTSEECGEYAFSLSQYNIFVQKELNFHNSKVKWCEDTILYLMQYCKSEIANPAYLHIKTNEKAIILSAKYPILRELLKLKRDAQLISDNLNSVSKHVENMSRTLINLQQNKRKQ